MRHKLPRLHVYLVKPYAVAVGCFSHLAVSSWVSHRPLVNKMAKAESPVQTTTLLLFGKTGSGRSATGNSILGSKAFAASPMLHATTTYKVETCERDGRNLKVVDTPDITESLDHLPDKGPDQEVARWLVETKDGIDALLLVHKFGVRFTDQQKTLIGALEKYFGKEIYKYIIVVLTHGDQVQEALEDGSLASIEDYVSEDWGGLPKLMKKVDNRYVVFNNRIEDEDGKKKQMKSLMDFVKLVSDQTKGPFKSPYCSGLATVTTTTSTDPKAAAAEVTAESSVDPIPFEEQVDIVYKAMEAWYKKFLPSFLK